MWRVSSTRFIVEVTPLNDLMLHHSGTECLCRPFWRYGVLVHNSFDGREIAENAKAVLADPRKCN